MTTAPRCPPGWRLDSLTEKPAQAAGSYANISRYFLPPQAFRAVVNQRANPETGESMITDTVTRLAENGPIGVSIATGQYFDCGSLDGWHQANVAVMATR
ncbi:sugar phosphate nucleotidyltransferase [Microlunatus soli]|uniref:sugar phosphate nucleotidyltransferase n=1 Tax=Microlunatus soli TaxID=630515 RepID=UPI000B8408E3|nr:sugar phosphate nucleotidyltransferase [Microlunatus soli]